MFYLKYRPKTVQDIDNSRVRDVVFNVLKSESLPHAFLLIGQKGTGKTSTARIFAKSVNCLKNKFSNLSDLEKTDTVNPERHKKTGSVEKVNKSSMEPCNLCENCLAIDHSSSGDVVELDAASNRGIENIRNLIRDSNFLPMSNRYRVFIIDEAHMITNDAFNALLKTLEEPPSSVIFILATTNQEKIPETISSRCFIINFGRAKRIDIFSMLKKISLREKIQVDEKLLNLIARYSDSSFRDAAKILEELVTQNKLTYEQGRQFLGVIRDDLLEGLVHHDLKASLEWVEEFSKSGGNVNNLIEFLLEELHTALLLKNGVKIEEGSDLNLKTEQIVKLMKLLTEAYNNLKISPIESLPLEIAIVEFYSYNFKKQSL